MNDPAVVGLHRLQRHRAPGGTHLLGHATRGDYVSTDRVNGVVAALAGAVWLT